jgi:hypothetical protein
MVFIVLASVAQAMQIGVDLDLKDNVRNVIAQVWLFSSSPVCAFFRCFPHSVVSVPKCCATKRMSICLVRAFFLAFTLRFQTVRELAPNVSTEVAKFLASEATQQAASELANRMLVKFLASAPAQEAAAQFMSAQLDHQGPRLFQNTVWLLLIGSLAFVCACLIGAGVGVCLYRRCARPQESAFQQFSAQF